MNLINKIKNKILIAEDDLHEKDKNDLVNAFMYKIQTKNFTHTEQSEILNRIIIRVWESKKQKRKQLIVEARELQESMLEIPLKSI